MAVTLKIPPFVKSGVDTAFNRCLIDGGGQDSMLGQGFTSLIQQVSGAGLWAVRTQSGASATLGQSDLVVLMSSDALRTASLPGAAPAGTVMSVVDVSSSVDNTHTITISATSGNINGGASVLITPTSNTAKVLVSDGANWWVLAGF